MLRLLWKIKSLRKILRGSKKCRSLVETTGACCQDPVIRGTPYCYTHQGKFPWFIRIVAVLLAWGLGLATTTLKSKWWPSESDRRITELTAVPSMIPFVTSLERPFDTVLLTNELISQEWIGTNGMQSYAMLAIPVTQTQSMFGIRFGITAPNAPVENFTARFAYYDRGEKIHAVPEWQPSHRYEGNSHLPWANWIFRDKYTLLPGANHLMLPRIEFPYPPKTAPYHTIALSFECRRVGRKTLNLYVLPYLATNSAPAQLLIAKEKNGRLDFGSGLQHLDASKAKEVEALLH
jgi:hypothetical protein